MAFSRAQIAAAKQGTHKIRWQPDRKPEECRVRGDHVYVEPVSRTLVLRRAIQLNGTASQNLVEGKYR
jgi:uncharacterized protein (UPF0248 family)